MDAEPEGSNPDTQSRETEKGRSKKDFGGLHECICFEHIDSIVGS